METLNEKVSIDESAKRYERKLQDAYNEIDKSHIRYMQKNMYLCAAQCCESSSRSYNDVQNCVENCAIPLNNTQQYLKNEFQELQNRIQRCFMVCNDEVKEKMELEKSTKFSDKYKFDYENCANSCLTKYSDLLPSIILKIKNRLDESVV